MLSFTGSLKVFLALVPCDLRKGFSGLQTVASESLHEELRSGALLVFCNKGRTRLKMLYWDENGLWLLMKRLEEEPFSWPRDVSGPPNLKAPDIKRHGRSGGRLYQREKLAGHIT